VEKTRNAAGGNGRSCSQIVHNARSSAKASASSFFLTEVTHVFLQFSLLPRYPLTETGPSFPLKRQFSKRRKYEGNTYGRSIDRSIDRLHAHMHVVYAGLCRYAGYEIRRVCVCMMLQV